MVMIYHLQMLDGNKKVMKEITKHIFVRKKDQKLEKFSWLA